MAQIWHRQKNRRVSVDNKDFSSVARDGIAQHYTALTIPLTGICLNPALGLTNATAS